MANPSRSKGTLFEVQFRDYLRQWGHDVERLGLNGVLDEGDTVVREPGGYFEVVENKAEAKYDIPRYLREIEKEKENFRQARGLEHDKVGGVVVMKLRGLRIGRCAVITTVDDYWGIP